MFKLTETPIAGHFFRIVESQEQVATTALVDSLEEQALLENLLEDSKPARPTSTEHLHYLLATPFRYPPLPWGSRFGRVHEPGLLYGGLSVDAALSELAFYRFLFFFGMATPPPNPLSTQHLLFEASYATHHGIQLQDRSWADYHQQLTDPVHYGFCQDLGAQMRRTGTQAFEFISARAIQAGITRLPYPENATNGLNVALFTPAALNSDAPTCQTRLLANITPDQVTISLEEPSGRRRLIGFEVGHFLVDGRLSCSA